MSCDPETQIQQQQPQQNDMFFISGRQIEQQHSQQKQNDMPLVSGRQIEQPQSEQNDMSWNTEPRMSAVERVHLQPCSATTMTGNMVEEALANIQLADSFHAEETLAHDLPLASFPNFASNQNFQLGTLDDASLWKLFCPSDAEIVDDLIMQMINNMDVQQQNDMSFNSGRQIQQPQQNDMSLVSGRQIEQQQSHQNDMSLPRTSALQPFSATAMTIFHPGFTGNMEEEALAYGHPLAAFPNVVIPENFSEEQSNPNRQLANNFIAEQVLAHDLPLATFPNIASNQNSQLGTLDDASLYGSLYPFDTPLFDNPTMLQTDNMQQSMHHNQMYPMNFEPSSTIISGNPAFASQNYNFGMNMGHGSQSIQDGSSIGEGILDQYSTIDSIYHPQFQNAGLPSGAARRFVASNSSSQNPSVDDKSSQK
ncbi:uncharacterized protein HKW66_Vig0135040 [Vigna angularis]|nr:uncharacterized protein HKW66_Vig0135040 [Vigna angularis]